MDPSIFQSTRFSKIFVIRHSPLESVQLAQAAESIVGKTKHQRPAKTEEAPDVTDCLTVIHYIFKQALHIDIPVTYIGDVPRQLIAYGEWRALVIERESAQCGDLIFVANKEKPKLLSHVAMFLGADRLFHCNSNATTAVIENYEQFSTRYEQRLNFRQAVRYIDSRNQSERAEAQDIFYS